MFLKRLEIHGFKSFGERTKLEFGRGITAIVGPNGSGKSNIADGIRWVLGEQSARSLRGETMQDVIFAGSDGKGPLGMASVSLTLGDCEGHLSLDFDEITVTRRVYRSGESQYLINKSPCRLRDIRDLFLDTGLGREGYYLIGQGQIDAILSARPEERRLFIEEAAGIGKYRARKMEATRKLAETEASLVRLDDLVSELERQLEPLQEAATKAKTYINLAQEYQAKGQAVCAYEWAEFTREAEQCREEAARLSALLMALDEEQKQEETKMTLLRQELQDLENELDSLQEERTNSIQAMGEIQRGQDMAQEKMKQAETDSQRLLAQLGDREKKRYEARHDLAACLWRLRSLNRRRTEELRMIEEFVASQSQGQTKREAFSQRLEKIGASREESRQLIAEIQGDLEAGESRKALWQEQITVLSHRLDEILGQQETICADLAMAEKALLEAEETLGISNGQIEQHGQEMAELAARHRAQEEKVRVRQERLQVQSSRFKALQGMEKDYVGYYRGVKAVMQAQARLTGILGVVAELIQVPKELENAIEIVLGNGLQNIVTETDADARRAVAHLKEKQAGRATFLPLDGLRVSSIQSRDRALLRREGVVGVASELVCYEPQYRAMVQYLLGRVVVTKDLDTAVALGRELSSYSRIVTLEGDTVSPGGAITGGSLPKNDGNGLLQRRQQVSRLEEAIQASKASLEKEREIAEALESELRQAGLRAKALTEELHRAQLYIKELEKEVALKRNEKSRWDRESLAVHAEVEGLRARLEAEEDERTQRLERLECLEKEAQIWQEKLLQLQTDLALLEQDQIDTQEDYTAAKVSLATLESQIEAGKKEAARYRSILAEEANRIDEIRMTSAAVEEEKVRLQAEVKRLDQAYRQVKVKLSQTEERQSTQTKLRKETQSDLTAREEAHKARLEAKGQLQGELANATRVLDQVISRKARLTELMWDNYNLQPDDLKDLPIPDGDVQEVRRRIRALKDQIQLLGPVDTDMINHFEVVRERYGYLRRQQQDLLEAKEQLGHIIDEMDTVSMTRFMETLGAVQKEFQIVFTKLFGSGSADLVLLHASRLEEVGLDIQVRPPGKKAQNINLLSGGERALTAICLLFALLRVKPSPFCVLDEIDASLDESNLHRFTGLLEDFTQDTQFIVITHRPATMEAADMLYGVTMNKAHISQLVSVQLSEAAAGLE